jgi:hypothetical protein
LEPRNLPDETREFVLDIRRRMDNALNDAAAQRARSFAIREQNRELRRRLEERFFPSTQTGERSGT